MHAPAGHTFQPRTQAPASGGNRFSPHPQFGSIPVQPAMRNQPSYTSAGPSPRGTQTATSRPISSAVPTSRTSGQINASTRGVASAVPSKRVVVNTRTNAMNTTRKGKPSALASQGIGGSGGLFSYPRAANANLIKAQNQVPPLAQAGINNALAGQPMTGAQVQAMKNQLNNSKLSPAEQGSIATALQADAQMKRQLAATAAANGAGAIAGIAGAASNVLGSLGSGGGVGGGGSGSMGGGGGGSSSGGDGSTGGGGDGGDGDTGSAPVASGDGLADVTPVGGSRPAPNDPTADETDAQSGVRILAVDAGAAAELGGLRAGDVILSFAGVPTQSFDGLREAVGQASAEAKVIFINGENGQTEFLTVALQEGRLGVTCE